MLTAQQVAQFQRDGFLLGSKVLSDDQVDELAAEVLRVIDQRERKDVPQPVLCRDLHAGGTDSKTPIWQIVNIWAASPGFSRLIFHPVICEEIAQLTQARELRVWHDQIQYKPAEKGGVNMWHQDWPYWDMLSQPAQVTAWVALDDVDVDNGCMSMVPGSHLWGDQIEFLHTLKGYDQMPKEWNGRRLETRYAPVRRGQVHYHHALTWHGSHANTSGRPRRAIGIHYMTEATCLLPGQHPMMPFARHVARGQKLQGDHFPLVWRQPGA